VIAYLRQAIPWQVPLCGGLVTGLLVALVAWDPWTLWPLQAIAVGVLAAAAGWCFDEPAAAVVDVAPRGLAWRSAARALPVLALAGFWCGAVAIARQAFFGYPWHVAGQGVAAMALAAVWATWRRSAGHARPGARLTVLVVPACAAWGLLRPAERALPIFPYAPTPGPWQSSAILWAAAAGVALLGGALTLRRRW